MNILNQIYNLRHKWGKGLEPTHLTRDLQMLEIIKQIAEQSKVTIQQPILTRRSKNELFTVDEVRTLMLRFVEHINESETQVLIHPTLVDNFLGKEIEAND